MSYFLPPKLNPQGWLNDMLLPKLYSWNLPVQDKDGFHHKLKKAFYWEDYPGVDKKLISLHPEYRNVFIQSMQKISSNAGANPASKILDQDYVNFMTNIEPRHIAAMAPYVRVYLKSKVGGKKSSWAFSKEKDIIFRPFTDITGLVATDKAGVLQDKFMRGSEAGIESVTVDRNFPVWGLANSFNFNISYIFSSFQVFAQGHPHKDGNPKSSHKKDDYLLLLKPDLDNDRQVLVLEYGWKINKSKGKSFWGVGRDVLDTVEREERKTFKISWIKHDIEYQETGEVKLKVNYIGLPERIAFKLPKVQEDSNVLKPMRHSMLKEVVGNTQKELIADYEALEETKKEINRLTEACRAPDLSESERRAINEEKRERKEKIKRSSVQLEKMKREMAKKATSLYLKKIANRGKLFQMRFYSSKKDLEGTALYEKKPHAFEFSVERVGKGKNELIYEKKEKYGVNKSLEETLKKVKTPKLTVESDKIIHKQLDRIIGALTYSNFGAKKTEQFKAEIIDAKKPCKKGLHTPKGKAGAAGKGKKKCVPEVLPIIGEGRSATDRYGNFMFFPLRELFAVVNDFVKTENIEEGRKYPHISLGNIVYRPMGKELIVNIGDILIEASLFQKWFYKTVIRAGLSSIPYGKFLSLITEELIPLALGHGTSDLSSGMISDIVHTPFLTSEKFAANKKLDRLYLDTPAGQALFAPDNEAGQRGNFEGFMGFELLREYQAQVRSNESKKNEASILHFSQRVTEATVDTGFNSPQLKQASGRQFKRKKDQIDGMFHLFIGNSAGLMETISFSYTDNPNLRTALVFDKFKDIAFPYLKFAYSASPILTGNNLFYKGGYFVLPSSPLGISVEDDPGITGYYQISRLTDQLAPGTYKTSVQGMNIYSPANSAKDRKFQKIQEQCGEIEKKEREPKEIPIFLEIGLDEYVHSDFLKNPNYAKAYKLAIKTKKEQENDDAAESPPPDNITLGEGELLKRGAPREKTDKLQQKLVEKGYLDQKDYDDCKPKCPFGPKTEKAVKAYQKANKLEITGKVDNKTLGKLQTPPKPKVKVAAKTSEADRASLLLGKK